MDKKNISSNYLNGILNGIKIYNFLYEQNEPAFLKIENERMRSNIKKALGIIGFGSINVLSTLLFLYNLKKEEEKQKKNKKTKGDRE